MPIYEYRCRHCGERFELLVRRVSNSPAVVCEKCNSPRVEKLVSGFSLGGGDNTGTRVGSCGSCSAASCSSCS